MIYLLTAIVSPGGSTHLHTNTTYNNTNNNQTTLSAVRDPSCEIKIYRSKILPLLSYGCETWSLTLREERRLRVSENRVLRRIFGAKRDEVTGNGENYIMRGLKICTAHQILFTKNVIGGACGMYRRQERCI
jgi:hypothetical protein